MTIMLQIQLFLINQYGVSKESLVNIRKRHIKVFVELYEGIVNLLHRQCVTCSVGFSQFLYMVFHQRAYGCLDFWLDCLFYKSGCGVFSVVRFQFKHKFGKFLAFLCNEFFNNDSVGTVALRLVLLKVPILRWMRLILRD